MLRKLISPVYDLWKHRELLWQFTRRNFELTMRGSHLGLLWSFLNPLLLMGLYVGVFGYIFGGKYGVKPDESPMDYAVGIFLSLTIFNLVSEVICVAPTIIISNPNFVKRVVFPLEILPAAAVGASIIRFLISITLVFIAIAVWHVHTTWQSLWLVAIIVPILLLSVGTSWCISALGVFIRDIGQTTIFLSQALMYASAVFYSAKIIPNEGIWTVLHYNPLLYAIDMARGVVLWQVPMNYPHLAYLYGFSAAVFILGHAVFRRLKPAFADVL
jgi:lipopolysaccharide transport system permease protein